MKKPTNKRLDMTVYQRSEPVEGKPRDIMDAQDNTNRGDGEAVAKIMTTFMMEARLKEKMRSHCRANGLKMGDFINQAIREALS